MVMGHFNSIEQSEILEFARLAMADEDIASDIGEKMDINSDYIVDLTDKIIDVMENRKELQCWNNIDWLRAYVNYVQKTDVVIDRAATEAADLEGE